jgi:hypothetical protein
MSWNEHDNDDDGYGGGGDNCHGSDNDDGDGGGGSRGGNDYHHHHIPVMNILYRKRHNFDRLLCSCNIFTEIILELNFTH